jgi:hypothetical protein
LPDGRAIPGDGASSLLLPLEKELQRKLHEARVFCLSDLTELRSVSNIAVRVIELRVVEDVEKLGAKFKVFGLAHRYVFQNREIGVADSGSAANGAGRVADGAEVTQRE